MRLLGSSCRWLLVKVVAFDQLALHWTWGNYPCCSWTRGGNKALSICQHIYNHIYNLLFKSLSWPMWSTDRELLKGSVIFTWRFCCQEIFCAVFLPLKTLQTLCIFSPWQVLILIFQKWTFLCDSTRGAKCICCWLDCKELFLQRFLLSPHADVSVMPSEPQEV